jgi:hypothetical protein
VEVRAVAAGEGEMILEQSPPTSALPQTRPRTLSESRGPEPLPVLWAPISPRFAPHCLSVIPGLAKCGNQKTSYCTSQEKKLTICLVSLF